MPRLEDLTPGAQVKGILAGGPVTVIGVKWHGSNALELTYKDGEGRPDVTLLYRDHEPSLEILQPGRQWSFTADGDLRRFMVVSPGNLVEQWQDELDSRFSLPFEILTNDKLESARTGNRFQENDLIICRLDKLSRDESLHAKLEQTDWDLIVCDEAHKMTASFFGGEVRYTKRHLLGRLLGRITRHLLLMTATPHSGKEEDFQLFMSLLDSDRFEGKFRDGVHVVDVSDLMCRHVKEQLVRFDGTPLFPERKAYTVKYQLSDLEAQLYQAVTGYVRDEFNRADRLANEGRKGNVGFALTILQRRLASSPEAIHQSLLIMPASVPIDDPGVVSELTKFLEENWIPVIEQDVDGEQSIRRRLERDNPNLARYSAVRRALPGISRGCTWPRCPARMWSMS